MHTCVPGLVSGVDEESVADQQRRTGPQHSLGELFVGEVPQAADGAVDAPADYGDSERHHSDEQAQHREQERSGAVTFTVEHDPGSFLQLISPWLRRVWLFSAHALKRCGVSTRTLPLLRNEV
jgi:hypothetical protein